MGRRFVDSDDQIMRRTGRTGREVAEADGVDALHELERDLFFEAISAEEPSVVAAAASVVDDPSVRRALGSTVCVELTAPPSVLATRVSADDHRRVIGEDESERIPARARHFHNCADMTAYTDVTTTEEAVDMVLEWFVMRNRA